MRAGLYVTCHGDLFRPGIGFAALRLLEAAGCEVVVPRTPTCCGQPKYNSGDRAGAQALARKVLGDPGCMLHIEGRLRRRGDATKKVLHVAEVPAGTGQE